MFALKTYNKLYAFGLGALVFTMLLFPRLVGLACVLFLGVLIIGLVKKELTFKLNVVNLLFILLYAAYAIGVIFTNNQGLANKYLEYKLTFLIFPIFFSFAPKEEVSLRIPTIALTLGIVLLSIWGLINSTQLYLETNSIYAFTSGNFSHVHHPTYFSAYALLAMVLLYHGTKEKWKKFSWKWSLPLIFFMIIVQFMSMSLAGFLLLLCILIYALLKYIRVKFGKLYFMILLFLSPFLFILIVRFVPSINSQFRTSKEYIIEYLENPREFVLNKQTYVGGNETRLIMWTASIMEIKEHPMGVGTGNVDDHLKERLIDLGQPAMAKKGYNPHNQLLQTTIEIGIIGLAILLALIIWPFTIGLKTRDEVMILLATSLAFNSIFESMLQRQSGIVFYTFWICLVVLVNQNKKINRVDND